MPRPIMAAIIACAVATLVGDQAAGRPPAPGAVQHELGADAAGKARSLRLAIEDLIGTFGDRYPRGREYLRRLNEIGNEIGNEIDADGLDLWSADLLEKLRREALVANPLVSGRPLLFVARAADTSGTHLYMEPHAYRARGSALRLLDLETGQTTTLLDTSEGIIRGPCVHFDGRRILLAMSRGVKDNFHIFEITLESTAEPGQAGGRVKQLTDASDVSDVDPIYMPDGSIVFASTREIKYVPCDTQNVPQLFRMAGDGTNIHQITRSTAHENQLSLTADGRILYSRWDYVDRNFGDGHGFWVANPDGTGAALIWGNNTTHPSAGWFARFVPGTGRVLCILGTHHGNLGGALAVLDPQAAIEGAASIVRTWPAEVKDRFRKTGDSSLQREGNSSVRLAVETWSPEARRLWSDDANMRMHRHDDEQGNVRPWYNTPWPLSENYFLCVRSAGRNERSAIYLVDTFGNEILLHEEDTACYSPMPLAPHPKPVAIPARRDYGSDDGLFYVQNVYEGTHMTGVERGAVKALRVVEVLSKRGRSEGAGWNGLGMQTPAMNWTEFNAKRILGTVPVAQDGSAYFAVPSDRFVYFQLLDAGGMMIQSMRSGTSVHSGETISCVGCHESRQAANKSPRPKLFPSAAARAPSTLRPWYGPPRRFSYLDEVQPVLEKHCVECHDFGTEGAKKVVLAGDRTASFNVSYMELWRKGYLGTIGAGPAGHLPAYSWGSHRSRLIRCLQEGHKQKGHQDLKLDRQSLDRLITWVDLNGPYYPTTYTAYPHNPPGRCPLDRGELARLGRLAGFTLRQVTRTSDCLGPMISFDRPELSPCLATLEQDPLKYDEALAIIRQGQRRLHARPRADMPGFVPWEKDLQRQAHLQKYRRIDLDARKAIRDGALAP